MCLRRTLSLAALAATLGLSSSAHAAEPMPVVVVEGIGVGDADGLRKALLSVVERARPGVLTVHFSSGGRSAEMRFVPVEGPPIARGVDLPASADERTRALVWLAENLTRDESAELVPPLEKRASKPPSPPSPPPETTSAASSPSPSPPASAPMPSSPKAETGTPAVLPRPKPPIVAPRDPCDDPAPSFPVSLTLASPVGFPSRPVDTVFALSLAYADLRTVDGAGIGMVMRTRCHVRGAMISLVSLVGGRLEGVGTSALYQDVRGKTEGVAISGVLNRFRDEADGVALATANVYGGEGEGFAASGSVNLHRGAFRGASIAPIVVGLDGMEGLQLGVLNVTKGKVSGLQLGVVNVAEDADVAIGVFSIALARPIRPIVLGTVQRPVQAGVLFEQKYTFSEGTVGWGRRRATDRDHVVLGLALGAHLVSDEDKGLLVDLVVGADGSPDDGVSNGRLTARVGYRFSRRFAPQLVGGALLLGGKGQADAEVLPDFGASVTF